MDELKSAGLLRKGQVLGGVGELGDTQGNYEVNDVELDGADLLSKDFEEQFADEFETLHEDT